MVGERQNAGRDIAPQGPPAASGAAASPRQRRGMSSPLLTELMRSIGTSWTRFLAIMAIVGLGVGFYAGLNMVGNDMRQAADNYYDGTHLYDLRVISTLGLLQGQVDRIAELEGVESAAGAYAADVMASLNDKNYAMRIMSCDMAQARTGIANKLGTVVDSPYDGYLNRLVLAEGTWPSTPSECLLSADSVTGEPTRVGDTVEVLYGTAELDGVLDVRRYTVSGLVHTSFFPSSISMGYTNLGSGIIKGCVFVPPEAFSSELPFTEVFVTVEGARELESDSDAYQARVDEVAERIEGLGLGTLRLAQIKDDAEDQYADAEAEYLEGRAKADEELGEAARKLNEARKQLEEGAAALAAGQRAYDAGVAQLADGRAEAARQLAAGRDKLVSSEQLLDDAERQLGMSQADIDAKHAELAAAEQQLNDGEQQLGMTQADIDAKRAELAEGKVSWEEQRAKLLAIRADLVDIREAVTLLHELTVQGQLPTREQLADAREKVRHALAVARDLRDMGTFDTMSEETRERIKAFAQDIIADLEVIDFNGEPEEILAQLRVIIPNADQLAEDAINEALDMIDSLLSQGDQTIADAQALLDKAQEARDQLDAGRAALADGRAKLDVAQHYRTQIDQGRAQLAAGWRTYHEQEARANDELSSAQQQLDEAASELAAGRAELESGRQQYADGVEQYYLSRADVESRLADAASQLAAARADIDNLEEPSIYVLDRTTNTGIVERSDDAKRIDSIASFFPFIFFLVAALVSLTTMTRMVEDERVDIGTHKALGFSTAHITAKYVAYAAIASLVGSLLFIVFLSQLLPQVVQVAYDIVYNIPLLPLPLPIDMGKVLVSVGIGLGITLVVIFAAAGATLREVPAALMLPRAPKAGKRILLERASFLWSKLSFSWKVTFRNLFRYKQRFVMTVVGIMGCTALLLTGFGLHNAIWDIIEYEYEGARPISLDTVSIGLKQGATADDMKQVEDLLVDLGDASVFMRLGMLNKRVSSDVSDESPAISVMVIHDYDTLPKLTDLRDRKTKTPVEFCSTSVVLSEKMAKRLGLRVGDTFTLYDQDEIGNAVGDGHRFVLTGISESYVRGYLAIGADAWREATGEPYTINAIQARTATDEQTVERVAEALSGVEAVSFTSFNNDAIDSFRTMLKAVNMIVVVLVVAAAALDFIVLYNLINIQLIERVREIASLKVLGFNRREVANYLFRETFILVVIGALVGLVAGTVLEGRVVQTAEVDMVMFGRDIHLMSYLLAFGLTLLFSLIVMAMIAPKLHRIDMVESLKSVD